MEKANPAAKRVVGIIKTQCVVAADIHFFVPASTGQVVLMLKLYSFNPVSCQISITEFNNHQ